MQWDVLKPGAAGENCSVDEQRAEEECSGWKMLTHDLIPERKNERSAGRSSLLQAILANERYECLDFIASKGR